MPRVTMTVSTTEYQADADDVRVARLAAIAIVLAVVEAGVPAPIPGVKPGIANIVTLLALLRFGWPTAAWVSLLRIAGSGVVLGGFFSPGFALSAMGGLCSLGLLFFAQYLPARWFGPVSLSILAAFAHIAGQLALARLWLIPHNGILYLFPAFFAAALVFGLVNGLVVMGLLAREEKRNSGQVGGETTL